MAGCGADGGEPVATNGSANGSGSGAATSVNAGSDTGNPVPPPESSGSPVPFTQDEVSVRQAADHYAVGAVVHVTVANGLDRTIYTEDFKTACSIVILQRRDGDAWTDIRGCRLGRPTATVATGPGLGHQIELDPASSHLASGADGPAFGPGTYRVKFAYRVEPEVGDQEPPAVYSAEFPVR